MQTITDIKGKSNMVISLKPNKLQKGAVGQGIAEPRKTALHHRVVRGVAFTMLGITNALSKLVFLLLLPKAYST